VKSDWFDHRLRANASLFDIDYEHKIVNQLVVSGGIPFTAPLNIGSATYKGAELEVDASPVDDLLLTGNFSVLNMKLNPLPGAPAGYIDGCVNPKVCVDANPGVPGFQGTGGTIPIGSIPPGVPEDLVSLTAQYVFHLGGSGDLTPRLDWRWQSKVYSDNPNSNFEALQPYSILNARLTWDAPADNWQVAFEAMNLGGERYFINKFDLISGGLGTLEGQPGSPREWFLTLRKTF
jgi:iron complex outermembrane receptor protein